MGTRPYGRQDWTVRPTEPGRPDGMEAREAAAEMARRHRELADAEDDDR